MNPIALFLIPALALAVASAAPQEHCGFNGEDNLSCTLRTLQSDLHEDFDVGRARSISIKCGDGNGQFFSESHLKSEHFGNLPFLEELSIESCKMRRIPARAFAGLTNLRRLNLQSHNAEWSSVVMEVVRHAFDNMNQLEELNLAQNNLWSLPSGVFCSMPSLKAANLSGNHLLDVTDVGLSADAGCLANVAHLDLSENEITALRSGDLAQVEGKLKSLDLSHNRVAILGDEALSGLDSLLELNLGGNQLSALPPTVFNKSSSMQKLFLQNNTLTLLPAGIFGGLDGLVLLNLSHNAISSHLLSEETFNGLESLQMLDLSHNHMTKIQTSTFKTLVQLQVLYLQNNKIHTLAAGSFVRQAQLKMLSLSFNRLENITSDILVGLSDLTSLSLDNNGIKEVDIVGTPMLTDLALNKNQLRKVPSFIKSSTVLRTLDLGDNHISEIGDDEFSGLPNLYGLRLASNGLKHVSNGTFSDASNVHILNLAHNQIESMEVGAFSQLKELRVLRLDNNELEDINGLVSHLGKLEWFKVSGNNLQWFDYAFIPSSLEWLDIASNAIAELGNFYNLDNFGVKTLRAEGNKLKRLSPDSFPASLENIHISDNEIADVEPFTFERQRDLKTVDLSDNYLQTLYKDALRVKTPKGRPDFALGGNQLNCDCHMGWLQTVNGDSSASMAYVADYDSLECRVPTTKAVQTVSEVPQSEFLCTYTAHCSSQCMCCDFYACDCRFQCPEGCSCFHDSNWSQNVVSCSAKGHKHVPILIPLDATVVRLDGNNLRHIDTQSFHGRDNVRELYLNGSNIISMSNNTFSGLTSLEVLHLEDNNIAEIRGFEFTSLTYLRELHLQNNDLVYINDIAFQHLINLRTLTLDGNLLTVFPVWKLRANPYLSSLSLSRNTWSCECDFIQPFNAFLESNALSVSDYDIVQCVSENIIDEATVRSGHLLCAAGGVKREKKSSTFSNAELDSEVDLSVVLIPIVMAIITTILVILAVFVFRAKIKAWLYAKSSEVYDSRAGSSTASTGGSLYGQQQQQNNLFDVYISYSMKDTEFVEQTVSPTLEHGATYKLCLHQRNFPPSATLYDTVTEATVSSSKVLIVLSKAYVEAEWPHVHIPLRNATQDKTDKIIFLLVDDLTEETLLPHPELCHFLRTCPSVKWGSHGFLNKLRFFLPEPAFLTFQRNITLRNYQRSLSVPHSTLPPPPPPAPPSYIHANIVQQQQQQQQQLYGLVNSYGQQSKNHVYQSIPDNHIYHTLEPGKLVVQPPKNTMSPVLFHHTYTHSTSSGQQLLPLSSLSPPTKNGKDAEEYIV